MLLSLNSEHVWGFLMAFIPYALRENYLFTWINAFPKTFTMPCRHSINMNRKMDHQNRLRLWTPNDTKTRETLSTTARNTLSFRLLEFLNYSKWGQTVAMPMDMLFKMMILQLFDTFYRMVGGPGVFSFKLQGPWRISSEDSLCLKKIELKVNTNNTHTKLTHISYQQFLQPCWISHLYSYSTECHQPKTQKTKRAFLLFPEARF